MIEQPSALERGQEAMMHGAWAEALACFKIATEQDGGPEAHEGLSWAAWSLNEASLLFQAREDAFRLYHQAHDNLGAARMAM